MRKLLAVALLLNVAFVVATWRAVSLPAQELSEICDDGIDNDADGMVDCDDLDACACAGFPSCGAPPPRLVTTGETTTATTS
jgi:hypothetical protein